MLKIFICVVVAISIQNVEGKSVASELKPNASSRVKILGGDRTDYELNQFPYNVQILLREKHYCAGSIISENWILTAAHCLALDLDPKDYAVVANRRTILYYEGAEKKRLVSKLFINPGYIVHKNPHDIALIKLASPFTFDERVFPIALPAANYTPAEGVMGRVAGWGLTSEDGNELQDVLRYIKVPFVNDDVCRKIFVGIDEIIDAMICAGGEEKRDACQGDSGGALVVDLDGAPRLVGVVSFGYGCGRVGLPGVYSEVAKYVDWINETMDKN